MTKVKIEQLDNKGQPTGLMNEVDKEVADRILSKKSPKWREFTAKEKKSTKKED